MKMKKLPGTKKVALVIALLSGVGIVHQASAQVVVIDPYNYSANIATATASSIGAAASTVSAVENGVTAVATTALAIKAHEQLNLLDQIANKDDSHYNNVDIHNENVQTFNDYLTNIYNENNTYYPELPEIIEPIPEAMLAMMKAGLYNNEGNVDDYLKNFKDASAYGNESCFGGDCSSNQIAALNKSQIYGIDAQKKSNDAMLKTLDVQREDLGAEVGRMAEFGSKVAKAKGQAQQMQVANQLAISQGNQMMKMRSLMLTEQTAQATRAQAVSDREAKQVASAQSLRRSSFESNRSNAPTSW